MISTLYLCSMCCFAHHISASFLLNTAFYVALHVVHSSTLYSEEPPRYEPGAGVTGYFDARIFCRGSEIS